MTSGRFGCQASPMLIEAARIIPARMGNRGGTTLAAGYVTCEGGRITAIGAVPPPRRPDVNLTEGFLLPGLVDLQVNGYFGIELRDGDRAGWASVARRLPATGTTAFLPTFVTSPVDTTIAALERAARFAPQMAAPDPAVGGPAGARVLGVHLEGPF